MRSQEHVAELRRDFEQVASQPSHPATCTLQTAPLPPWRRSPSQPAQKLMQRPPYPTAVGSLLASGTHAGLQQRRHGPGRVRLLCGGLLRRADTTRNPESAPESDQIFPCCSSVSRGGIFSSCSFSSVFVLATGRAATTAAPQGKAGFPVPNQRLSSVVVNGGPGEAGGHGPFKAPAEVAGFLAALRSELGAFLLNGVTVGRPDRSYADAAARLNNCRREQHDADGRRGARSVGPPCHACCP